MIFMNTARGNSVVIELMPRERFSNIRNAFPSVFAYLITSMIMDSWIGWTCVRHLYCTDYPSPSVNIVTCMPSGRIQPARKCAVYAYESKFFRHLRVLDVLNIRFWLLHWSDDPWHKSKARTPRPTVSYKFHFRIDCTSFVQFSTAVRIYISSSPVETYMLRFQTSAASPSFQALKKLGLGHCQRKSVIYICRDVPWISWSDPLNPCWSLTRTILVCPIGKFGKIKFCFNSHSLDLNYSTEVWHLFFLVRKSYRCSALLYIPNQNPLFCSTLLPVRH